VKRDEVIFQENTKGEKNDKKKRKIGRRGRVERPKEDNRDVIHGTETLKELPQGKGKRNIKKKLQARRRRGKGRSGTLISGHRGGRPGTLSEEIQKELGGGENEKKSVLTKEGRGGANMQRSHRKTCGGGNPRGKRKKQRKKPGPEDGWEERRTRR